MRRLKIVLPGSHLFRSVLELRFLRCNATAKTATCSHRVKSIVSVTGALVAFAIVAGCGSGKSTNSNSQAPTVTMSASPSSISDGASSQLTVTAANATQVVVTGSDGSSYTLSASGGTQAVSPTATTTYTATATGSGGSATAQAAVTVMANPPPAPTVSISASPTTIVDGSSSTLTVKATNATKVVVTGTDGSSYTLSASGGTQAVSPTATTTYTATASGSGGSATSQTVVTVTAPATPPTVSISASPTTIADGASSTLTVKATNATTVVVTGNDGSSYTLQPSGGTPSVNPSTTTTYTATATNSVGSVTAQTTVTVTPNPPPTVQISVNPTSMMAGSSAIVTVTAANASQVTLTGTDGSSYTLTATGGIQAVTPTATTTYTASATGPGGNASATVKLTVTPNPPPTVTISANPTSISPGANSTLAVSATNATKVVVTGTDGSSTTLQSTSQDLTVTPTATTTYTATATGPGGTTSATATVTVGTPAPYVTIAANPTTIVSGNSSVLTVTAKNATQVSISGNDGSSYNLPDTGGTQSVSPTSTTTYTVTATGTGGNKTASTTVTVTPSLGVDSIDHVIFMLQENHTFDNYFGMLNPYREANSTNGQAWNVGDDGNTYNVDGIDDKLNKISNVNDEGTVFNLFKFTSTCIDDLSSAWLESYGDVNRYNFATTRPMLMDGFVHTAEGFAKSCIAAGPGACSGTFTDTAGQRAMGYYDQTFLNYYYYMASQFALSDRWFSPVSSKSIDNRIATFTGGTTQGLVADPGLNDKLPQLNIHNIFEKLDQANVSWKIYYTVTQGSCLDEDDCSGGPSAAYPATNFSALAYSYQYLNVHPVGGSCVAPTQPSSVVGDASNSFCIDPNHIAPINDPTYGYYADLANGHLPSFAFIEAGYGVNDEHPGSGQSILEGQAEVAKIVNAFMSSSAWKNSVFFLSYDEGGGPYDHVPPVPGHSNEFTDASVASQYPDISSIAVNADSYNPCLPTGGVPTLHCDLDSVDPGANPTDAPAVNGFAAQLGFRVPDIVISPFARRHYVSHIPMDHTAIIKFVENRFIGPSEHLTARDAAQPNLLNFFNFNNPPWATPPIPPAPVNINDPSGPGYNSCNPQNVGP